jgi:hypothetical protein
MSPRTLLLAAALVAPALASVPAASAQTTFGLKAGLNVSDLTGDNLPGDHSPRLGFIGGGFANVALTPMFSVQPEVLYTQKGVSTDSETTEINADYIEVPVLAKFTVPATSTGLMIGAYAGPAISFRVKENTSANFVDVGVDADTDIFRSVDFGGAAGVTVGAGPFAVDGRYTASLRRATDEDETTLDLRHGVFSIMGSYTFGL